MNQLLEYLKLPLDNRRMNCIEKHSSGSFQRKVHQEGDPYSQELHEIINDRIEIANKLLIDKIGRPLPLDKYFSI